jgi:ATP-dependent DNA helicase RecG
MARSIDSRIDFLSPVSLIPGLGEKRCAALRESGINTIGDLLRYFPFRYIDRSSITPISGLNKCGNTICTIKGTVAQSRIERGRKSRLRVQIIDDGGGSLEAVWFHGIKAFASSIDIGMNVLCTGTVKLSGPYGARPMMFHPMIEKIGESCGQYIKFMPRYTITLSMHDAHLQQKGILKAVLWALNNVRHWPQSIPAGIENKKMFPPLQECMKQMHIPDSISGLPKYEARIIYEELYGLAIALRWNRRNFLKPGRAHVSRWLVDKFMARLPFNLTEAQSDAVKVLLSDVRSPVWMHRLLQGDVGCGKTVVAFLSCLPVIEGGFQVAWLAPTEVLARQTYSTLSEWCAWLGVKPELLTGSLDPAVKRGVSDRCSRGECAFVIGTHTLLNSCITFKKLGIVVIDEQHRFGARQRLVMQEKDMAADFLLMSATPIPKTLAASLYGDLDTVSIKELPAGRLPVKTYHISEEKRASMEQFILKEIVSGAQVYYVVPRIDSDDESDSLAGAESVYEKLSHGIFSNVACGMVHGRMDIAEQERIFSGFKRGDIRLLVATTIVEVGMDVPDATIMVVENADRLGLAQLHQLRGRVGRSAKQSLCFLLSNSGGDASCKRLGFFCKHNNGFEIAEKDMEMRGPGEVNGLRQAGADELARADIIRDAAIFREILDEFSPN